MRRTRRVDGKKCRDDALHKIIGPRKALYLCFSSERVAEAYIRYAAQHEPMEKSAETVLYQKP